MIEQFIATLKNSNHWAVIGLALTLYIAIAIGLIQIENKKSISKVGTISLFSFFLIIEEIISIATKEITLILGFFVVNVVFALLMIFIPAQIFNYIAKKDKAVVAGKKLIDVLEDLDIEITKIAYLVYDVKKNKNFKNKAATIHKMIDFGITDILNSMTHYSESISKMQTKYSILLPLETGHFKVLYHFGFSNGQEILELESKIKHKNGFSGIAGLAVNNKRDIIIPDLSDDKNHDTSHWVEVFDGEAKEGCIICKVLYWNVGNKKKKIPLAVLNVTTTKKTKEESITLYTFISRFVHKIETLLYFTFILDIMDSRIPATPQQAKVINKKHKRFVRS